MRCGAKQTTLPVITPAGEKRATAIDCEAPNPVARTLPSASSARAVAADGPGWLVGVPANLAWTKPLEP